MGNDLGGFVKRVPALLMLVLVVVLSRPPGYAAAQTPVPCEQEYTVTAGDWLSKIAEKFYGDVSAYNAIYLATNLKAQTDPTFATLATPDSVEVGDKLCIPGKADAEALLNTALAPTPTSTSAAPVSASPTVTPVAPASPSAVVTGLRPEDVSFNAYGLSAELQGRIVPASAYDNSAPPGPVGAPAHVAFQFDGTDRLWVLPADAYRAQWDAAGNDTISRSIATLRLLLRDRPETVKPPLPFLPPVPATNDLGARIRYLEFDGGSGIAFLGRWAQDPSPILASQIDYSFVGLTNDGRYIVSFRYPVQTSALPDDVSELTPEHLAEIQADPQTYFAQTTELLNGLANSNFGPDLSRLDALVFSLHVPSTGAPLPPPVGSAAAPNATSAAGDATPSVPPAGDANAELKRLLATDWKWHETKTPSGTITVDDPAKYTVRFNNAGGFGITADCNIGAGNYRVSGNALTIEDLQATRVACGEGSLDAQFSAQLLQAATFTFQGADLLIELQADGGTMRFGK